MLNETITFFSGVDIYFLAAFFCIIGGVITIFMFFLGILPYIKSKNDFSDLFIYRKAKKLQQNDFGIQFPPNANKEVYKRRQSDDEIERYLKSSNNVSLLIKGMPKSGKTRSAYQAIKSVFPEFYAIKPPAEKLPKIRLPWFRKDYLIFFDDLNKFAAVDFDFSRFLDKFKYKSKRLVVIATCRSGDEFEAVRTKSMDVLRTFQKVVELDEYKLCEAEGRELAKEAGVKWKPEQFLGTPGSVILDIGDMRNRYKNLNDREKTILRTCKLLKRANIFIYEKALITEICSSIFKILISESSWIDSITHLKENSLVTKSSIPKIDVYDPTLESVVDDYDPVYHLEALLNLLIKLEDAKNLFYLGNAFYKDKNYKNGEKSYNACLKISPESAEAHYNLGVLLYDLKKYEEAEKEYGEAVRINPESAEAHYNLGILLYNLTRYDEADVEFRKAIRIKPDYAEAHNSLGYFLYNLKKYEEAEKEYRGAVRIKPDYTEAHRNLGVLLYDLERYEEAEKEYREVARIKTDYAETHYNLGLLLYNLKRYEEAEKEYREAVRIKPDYAEAHYNLGILLSDLKRFREAEREYKEAVRINPDFAEAHANLGILFLIIERSEEAKKELEIAKRLFEAQGREEDIKNVEELLRSL